MMARYFVSVTMGAAVTFSLLYLMQHLISIGEEVLTPSTKGGAVTYVRAERDEEIGTRRWKPDLPPEVLPIPPVDQPPVDLPPGGLGVKISELRPPEIGPRNDRLTGYAQSGELLPIVAVAPAYPARALARHLEGYVVVEYTVMVTGGVRDAFVVASSSSIFDRSAIEAAYKFKYKPRVVDGQPVETPGVQRKFTFVLED